MASGLPSVGLIQARVIILGNNLPPGVGAGDSDAPWNQITPEPHCPDCDEVLGYAGDFEEADADESLYCLECKKGIPAEDVIKK